MTKKQQIYTLIGFIIGFMVALISAGLTNQTPHFKEHSQDGMHAHMGTLLVTQNAPSIEIESVRVSNNNVDIKLKVEHFRFAPENADKAHIEGEGHAHIYIDNIKVSRAYGEWSHISNLKPGKHTIRVSLNTNDHKTYMDSTGVIEDSIEVEI